MAKKPNPPTLQKRKTEVDREISFLDVQITHKQQLARALELHHADFAVFRYHALSKEIEALQRRKIELALERDSLGLLLSNADESVPSPDIVERPRGLSAKSSKIGRASCRERV